MEKETEEKLNHIIELVDTLAINMSRRFDQVDSRLLVLESDGKIMKSDIAEIKTNVDDLRNDHKNTRGDIAQLASVAEVSDLNDRVTRIEQLPNMKLALA